MKAISTVDELRAFLAEHPEHRLHTGTLGHLSDEQMEEWVSSGRRVMVLETADQPLLNQQVTQTLRSIGRRFGWKAAARHLLSAGNRPPLSGKSLASFAAHLRRNYG